MNAKEMLDYAWNWFEYHATQRMATFRFFLILLAALLLALATVGNDGKLCLASAIAAFGAFISFAFLMLEFRNEALVNVGRNALLHVEESDESLAATPALQLLHIDRGRSFWKRYRFWLKAIYFVCLVLFLIAAIKARWVFAP